MGATSVTGVSGAGSVRGHSKGHPEDSFGANRIVGTRIVYASTATLSGGGTVSLDFPDIGGVDGDYVAFATDTNATVGAVNVTALTTDSIALKGTASHVVSFIIVRTGMSISTL